MMVSVVGQEANVGSDQVADVVKTFHGRGTLADTTPPTAPDKVLQSFAVREGFEIELMACEPDIGQPLFISWDSRGRMWVVQYLQYQFPAGLKIVEYDNHLRAQFDKVPQPPPHGVKGADKISVLEDTDGDGRFDTQKDVITGLNIATSVVTGHGGIWVTNPPYLLFYPDENGDDIPDADPEVRLSGFGIEDTHSVMNSLEWGPDGWLYGVNGSTTTGKVTCPATDRVIEWQGQMVWRYQPDTRHFEIYAEGGGNTFSLEIDAKGRVFSGTNNGNTRGMYYPQGSYGKKGWGKHGPLTNPYAFGYFDHMAHQGDRNRFAQAFSIYEGGLYPEEYNGIIIAPNSLHNVVWVSQLLSDTSTFQTNDEADLIKSSDRWFRPVFSGLAPDGCIYIADWYDTRLSHVRPVDDWHKSSGRIYRVKPTESTPAYRDGDLSGLSGDELLSYFSHPNRTVKRRAVLEVGWKHDHSIEPRLIENVRANLGQESLESLWAFALLDRLDDDYANEWINHPDADIRRWVIRLKGDKKRVSKDFGYSLVDRAKREGDIHVRSQLAATAKRVGADAGLAVAKALLHHSEDIDDRHIPLMIWWAVEANVGDGREHLAEWAEQSSLWELPLFRKVIAERLMRRLAMTGSAEDLLLCAKLLEFAPDENAKTILITGMQLAFQGTQIPQLPAILEKQIAEYTQSASSNHLVLGVQQGDSGVIAKAVKVVSSSAGDPLEKIELAGLFGTINNPVVVPALLRVLSFDQNSALKRVALQSLANYTDPKIPETILKRYGSTLPAEHEVRSTADRVLAGRLEWARMFLSKIELAHIKARDISPDVVQTLRQHKDPGIDSMVSQLWPNLTGGSEQASLLETQRLKQVLRKAGGSETAGRAIFQQRCAACHWLFDEGGVVAPDLTGYERSNIDFWLAGIVTPNIEIREEYASYLVTMKDGRVLMGTLAEQNPHSIKIRDAANQTVVISREKIEKLEASPNSMMPPGLLTGLSDQQIRDLFAWLMKQ